MRYRAFLACALLAACATTSQEFHGEVAVRSTRLVPVNPDVKVVADADKPMFFAANAYWMFYDGGWYRSASVHGPWIHDYKPPWQVRAIDQPYAFTHYTQKDQTAVTELEPLPSQPTTPPVVDRMRDTLFNFD